MPIYRVHHCGALRGEVEIHTAKNAVLPILCAGLLTREPLTIEAVPHLTDVENLAAILTDCGAAAERLGEDMTLCAETPCSPDTDDLLGRMRASVLVMGPLLARTGYARVGLPGGCAIGQRPIDLHLKGMQALGAEVTLTPGSVTLQGALHGGSVYLDVPSVGATENVLLASPLAEGTTRIENAAREPEIVDLCACLARMGAIIHGSGTATLTVEGVRELHGCRWRPIPDRIEAGTLCCAAGVTEGSLLLRNVRPDHMRAVLFKLSEAGMTLRETAGGLRVSGRARHAVQVRTLAYPGFPTDMQAPMMVLALAARGASVFCETIFENRFMHARELARLGASLRIEDRIALVEGGRPLQGAAVSVTDLRGGAAMMLAGLLAEGETTLHDPAGQIMRGYENLPDMLRTLGARVDELPDEGLPAANG